MSQERSRFVETGVIFSAQRVERSVGTNHVMGITPPFWTPSAEQITRLEGQLMPFLEGLANPEAKAISTRLGSYKRQYFGYTHMGKEWILVNSFCEEYWREKDFWHDRVVVVFDGGACFFKVRYDLSSSRFEELEINGDA